MSKNKEPAARYNVGDWVRLPWGSGYAVAQVIEQRGPLIGPERRHMYRIRLDREELEPDLFEVREDEVEPAPPPA